jgi:hypothetical protein
VSNHQRCTKRLPRAVFHADDIAVPAAMHRYPVITWINPDGSGDGVVARGLRNAVGFDFHPATKELWFADRSVRSSMPTRAGHDLAHPLSRWLGGRRHAPR